jgi:preprotein translocase subunit SecD
VIRVDHTQVNGTCIACHDGKTATGKPGNRYQLGPSGLEGAGISDAQAQFSGVSSGSTGWTVSMTPKDGADGRDKLNALSAACFDKTEQCPTGKLGIELDGIVEFAGTVQARTFDGAVQLSGNYTKAQANDLAVALRYGSLPVELVPQSTQTVSATLAPALATRLRRAAVSCLVFPSIRTKPTITISGAAPGSQRLVATASPEVVPSPSADRPAANRARPSR